MTTILDSDTSQADFNEGTLTNVVSDSDDYLRLESDGGGGYLSSGNRISPTLSLTSTETVEIGEVSWDLSSVGIVSSSEISWFAFPHGEDFTSEVVGNSPEVGWSVDVGSPVISSTSEDGNKSCYFPGNGFYHRIRSAWSFPVSAGETIDGKIRAKGDGDTAKLQMCLVYTPYDYDAFSTIIDVNPGASWTTYTGSITVPSGVSSAQVWVFNYLDNTGDVWVNDLVIHKSNSSGSVVIETQVSTDNGDSWTSWATCTNGDAIPDLPADTSTYQTKVKCRQSLSTTNTDETPRLVSLSVQVEGTYGALVANDLMESIAEDEISGTLEIQGWQLTSLFSATDSNTVAWTAGSLLFSDGNSFSISSGNTGNMTGKTYIYFSKGDSETELQTTVTAGNAVGTNKVLIGIAEDRTDEAFFYIFGGSGGLLLTADEIAANAITANKIAANTIEAGNIAAGTITTNEINFSPVEDDEVVASINASTEGITINGDKITLDGDVSVDGTFSITASSNISDVESGADVTSSNLGSRLSVIYNDSGTLTLSSSEIKFDTSSNLTVVKGADLIMEGDGDDTSQIIFKTNPSISGSWFVLDGTALFTGTPYFRVFPYTSGAGYLDFGSDNTNHWNGISATASGGIWLNADDGTDSRQIEILPTGITAGIESAFTIGLSSDQTLTAGTKAAVDFDTELTDLNGDFNTFTNQFVAPTDGMYHFSVSIQFAGVNSDSGDLLLELSTSNQDYNKWIQPAEWANTSSSLASPTILISIDTYMDSGDTAIAYAKTITNNEEIEAGYSTWATYFSGHMIGVN